MGAWSANDLPAGSGGLFRRFLVQELAQPNLEWNDVFDAVREKVGAASAGKQIPWAASPLSAASKQPAASKSVSKKPPPS